MTRVVAALLRVGVLVDSLTVPRWIRTVLEEVRAAGVAEIAPVVRNTAPDPVPAGFCAKLWALRDHLLYALYCWLDAWIFRTSPDAVELFRAVEFPWKWEHHRVLLDDVDAVDPALVEHDGRGWLFVTMARPGMVYNHDELFPFHAPTPFGPWTAHPDNPVISDQNCAKRYGRAIGTNRVIDRSVERCREEEVPLVLPRWAPGLICTHTCNTCPGLTVVDGLVRRPRP